MRGSKKSPRHTWYDMPIQNELSTSLQEIKSTYYQNNDIIAVGPLRSSHIVNRHGLQTKESAVAADSIFSINPSWIETKTRDVKLTKSRVYNQPSMKKETTSYAVPQGKGHISAERQVIPLSPRTSIMNNITKAGSLSSQRISLTAADPNNVKAFQQSQNKSGQPLPYHDQYHYAPPLPGRQINQLNSSSESKSNNNALILEQQIMMGSDSSRERSKQSSQVSIPRHSTLKLAGKFVMPSPPKRIPLDEDRRTPRRFQHVECASGSFFKKAKKQRQSGIVDAYALQKIKNKQSIRQQKRSRNHSQTAMNNPDINGKQSVSLVDATAQLEVQTPVNAGRVCPATDEQRKRPERADGACSSPEQKQATVGGQLGHSHVKNNKKVLNQCLEEVKELKALKKSCVSPARGGRPIPTMIYKSQLKSSEHQIGGRNSTCTPAQMAKGKQTSQASERQALSSNRGDNKLKKSHQVDQHITFVSNNHLDAAQLYITQMQVQQPHMQPGSRISSNYINRPLDHVDGELKGSEYSSMSFLPNRVDLESRYAYLNGNPQAAKLSTNPQNSTERSHQLSGQPKHDQYFRMARNFKFDGDSDQIDGLINLLHEAEKITGKHQEAVYLHAARRSREWSDVVSNPLSIIDQTQQQQYLQEQAATYIQNYRNVFPLDPNQQQALLTHMDGNKFSVMKRKILVGRNAGQIYRIVPQPCRTDGGKQIVSLHAMVPMHMMPTDMRAATMNTRHAQISGGPASSSQQCINQLVKSPRLMRELTDLQERVQRQIDGKQQDIALKTQQLVANQLAGKHDGGNHENVVLYDRRVRQQNQKKYRRNRRFGSISDLHGQLASLIDAKSLVTVPHTQIRIHYAIDLKLHLKHPINIVLRSVNLITRLLFRNEKNLASQLQANQTNSPGQADSLGLHTFNMNQSSQLGHAAAQCHLASMTDMPSSFKGNKLSIASRRSSNVMPAFHGTASQQDEAKLAQIRQIAQYLNIYIPKRLELNKQQIREFLQSRQFIAQIKIRMQKLLQDSMNQQNGVHKVFLSQHARRDVSGESGNLRGGLGLGTSGLSSQTKMNAASDRRKSCMPSILRHDDRSAGRDCKTNESTRYASPRPLQKTESTQSIPPCTESPFLAPKFHIGPGNNSVVVKNVMKQRYWWVEAKKESFQDANFIWTQWTSKRHLQYLQKARENQVDQTETIPKIYGKISNNMQLSDKKNLFQNMSEYYRARNIDPLSVLPETFVVRGLEDPNFQHFCNRYNEIQNMLKDYRRVRYQPRNADANSTDNKDLLSERLMSSSYFIKKPPLNTWIIKPGENSNRGCGINVCKKITEIRQIIGNTRQASHGKLDNIMETHEHQESDREDEAQSGKTFVIQKYIDNPLLINRRKFDFRVFALVTSINNSFKAYFYEDGYIRTSSREFDIQNLEDKFIHLTNDAVQKRADDFGKFENYNKMSFTDFQKYLNQVYGHLNINFQQHILQQMKLIVADTIRATYQQLDPKRLGLGFEIFGYDFMIDSDFKLYLIEVNTNPCLETDSPLLSRIIPELINSSFRLSIDPLFPCPDQALSKRVQPHCLPQEIKFQLIFDSLVDTITKYGPEVGQLVDHHSPSRSDDDDEEEQLSHCPTHRNEGSPDMVNHGHITDGMRS